LDTRLDLGFRTVQFIRVIDSTAANVAARFKDFLAKVELGEVVRVHENGHPVARLIRDADFMPGDAAAKLFKSVPADPEVATAIANELQRIDAKTKNVPQSGSVIC
jgi:antitoxin (DNA-binding transcriptional repressor) of toxin-antitoxin stability system